ncbi:CbiQ family ECF transporter T component [Desulfotignum phosphitoxidans]|uniref:Uncharacterized protein n=1 Tax=Desulfotignum phosphitoxidans DSM 13687 TaxID=1286635 RepID=S0FRW2_9BACT|nr:CbiQ family ECF transporter T component [Desulfotignum phosphitoxidans]EMS77450.1 hypothetical protein Dpo_15c00260 [Desulfotignum phosphitoxidans DSM 13687]
MTEVHHIQMPLWYLPLLVLIPAAVTAVAVPWLRSRFKKQVVPGNVPDWSIPPLDDGRGLGTSLIHRWDVRCKIVTLLAYSFAVASLHHLTAAATAVLISLAVLLAAKVSFHKVVLRVRALGNFLGMIFVRSFERTERVFGNS